MDQLLELLGHDLVVLAAYERGPHVPDEGQKVIPSIFSRFDLCKPQLQL
jgi:hypothetical protein